MATDLSRQFSAENCTASYDGDRLRVLGIAGSLRRQSFSHQALAYVTRLLEDRGVSPEVFDARVRPLPFCNGEKEDDFPTFPAVRELRSAVRDAHALVLVTPEYHGAVSGVLKNMLDLLDFEHMEGKVVAAISVLGGPHDCNALNDLRRIARWCHAWMIPEQVAIGHARQVFTNGELESDDIKQRLASLADSLIVNTWKLSDCLSSQSKN
jgi:FMN reductase